MSRFLLASADATFQRRLELAFGGSLGGHLRRITDESLLLNPGQALRLLAAEDEPAPDVVILGPDLEIDAALKVAVRFQEEHPEVEVVLATIPDATTWEKALRAGVRDVLTPGSTDLEIRETLERVALSVARRRDNLASAAQDSDHASRIITVVSPKGGSGKTTVATNLAVGLAAHAPKDVALIDLDLQFGDVISALHLSPEQSLADAAASLAGMDATALKTYLTSHSSGLFAFAAPDTPAVGETVTGGQISVILRLLASEFRYVIADTAAGIDEHALAALEASTDIVLLASMDVPSIRGLRKEIMALDELGMTSQRRHLVLNRADTRVGLDVSDVAATLGHEIDVAIPSSRAVALSVNQGSPLVLSDPKSPAAREMQNLVQRFVQVGSTASAGRWFKRKASQ